MSLKKMIEEDLIAVCNMTKKQGDENSFKQMNLKVIYGEIQRLPEKNPRNDQVIKILKKLKKDAKENFVTAQNFLNMIISYLPEEEEPMTEEEVEKWISDNINFGDFQNKMATIKIILGAIGNKTDGATVKKIIVEKF